MICPLDSMGLPSVALPSCTSTQAHANQLHRVVRGAARQENHDHCSNNTQEIIHEMVPFGQTHRILQVRLAAGSLSECYRNENTAVTSLNEQRDLDLVLLYPSCAGGADQGIAFIIRDILNRLTNQIPDHRRTRTPMRR
jgi:hypothetical protein